MPSHPPVSPLTAHLGYWLRALSNHVSQSFARRLEGQGVTVAEWVVLRALYDAEAPAPSALAAELGLTRGAISKLADRLAAKDLVERRASPRDGRAQSLCLTAAGAALVPRLAALADENDAACFAALPEAERAALERTVRALAARHGLTAPPLD